MQTSVATGRMKQDDINHHEHADLSDYKKGDEAKHDDAAQKWQISCDYMSF